MSKLIKTIAPFALLASGTAQAGIVDLFVDPPGGQVVEADGLGADFNEAGAFGTILGGHRDLIIEQLTNDSPFDESRLDVFGGQLSWSNDAGSSSRATVQWDGDDDSPALDIFAGLGGLDLTNGGEFSAFEYLIFQSDLPFTFSLQVFSSPTAFSIINLIATDVEDDGTPFVENIAFADFADCGFSNIPGGVISIICADVNGTPLDPTDDVPADFTSVNALQVIFEGIDIGGNALTVDLRIGAATTVPEPTSLALIGAGILAAGGAARRRMKNA